MNPLQQKIYDRFVRYVAVDTTSDPTSHVTPTTPSQNSFAHTQAQEMRTIGFTDVEVDEYGFVTGLIPANTDKKAPVIGLFAHMDTVCDYNGKDIRPCLHPNYDGGIITINAEKKMFLSPETDHNLKLCVGDDIVTADGNSLLAADDKIGIATIMTLAEHLLAHPEIKHGPVKAAFTIDEETGTGIAYLDVEKFGADFAYTIDGATLGEIDCGNFNADTVTIDIIGKTCHPGSAKGFMANPVRIAADIVSSWPEDKLPETTEGEEGFVLFKDVEGALDHAVVKGIVREHDLGKFEQFKKMLEALVEEKRRKYPAAKIDITFKKQYRNMRDILKERPQAMELLEMALKENNVPYRLTQARGGTDGARLSFMGLPCPNLCTGGMNFHGRFEYACAEDMESCVEILKNIAGIYAG